MVGLMITKKLRSQILAKYQNRCVICGRGGGLEGERLDIDHIVPKSLGGASNLDNLQVVCRSCNVLKHTSNLNKSELRQQASSAYHLEREVAQMLLERGFKVLSGATGPDAGVDLIAQYYDRQSKRESTLLIECKWSVSRLNQSVVTNFASKLEHFIGDYGLIVSNERPPVSASKAARSFGVSILTIDELPDFLNQLKGEQ